MGAGLRGESSYVQYIPDDRWHICSAVFLIATSHNLLTGFLHQELLLCCLVGGVLWQGGDASGQRHAGIELR